MLLPFEIDIKKFSSQDAMILKEEQSIKFVISKLKYQSYTVC